MVTGDGKLITLLSRDEVIIILPRCRGALSDTATRPSVCPSCRRAPSAIDTLAACSLSMCGLRTRPRTDIDPPRVELPSAGGGAYCLAAVGMITCVYVDAGEPKFESEKDELKSVNVTEGDRLSFPCRVTAEPVADIVWLRNGIPLDSEPRCFHALLPSHRDLVVCICLLYTSPSPRD